MNIILIKAYHAETMYARGVMLGYLNFQILDNQVLQMYFLHQINTKAHFSTSIKWIQNTLEIRLQ